MRRRILLFAGVTLALLTACEGDPGPRAGRAAPPDQLITSAVMQPTNVAPAPTPESDNREMTKFLADNLIHLRKYPNALRVAAVVGTREMDLRVWPGTVIADEIRAQGEKCGTPVEFVSIEQDFDLLAGFVHRERDGAQDQKDRQRWVAALTRNRLRAAQSLADVLNIEMDVNVETDVGNAKGDYPYDRWHQFLNYKVPEQVPLALLQRMPVETWREQYDKVVAEIAPTAPDTQAKRDRTEEFRTSYLDGVMAICPNNFFADLMRRADVDVAPEIVTTLLRDGRVREGMTREQFSQASLTILNGLRPGK